MPDEFEYIERYLEGKFSPQEVTELERRISSDPELAEQMAFYISTFRALKQSPAHQTKERFRNILAETDPANIKPAARVRSLWPYLAAAAASAIVVIMLVFYPQRPSPAIADRYIASHLQTFPVTMDNDNDNFKTAVRLYNEGQLNESLTRFEIILRNDSSNFKAKENAGIVSLRLNNYDKAIEYFQALEVRTDLYANPGKFYHALTLLKRNRPGDRQQARLLLQVVVRDHLDLDREAQQLLRQL